MPSSEKVLRVVPQAKEVVAELKASGYKILMLTGDTDASAKSVANTLGINEFHHGTLNGSVYPVFNS